MITLKFWFVIFLNHKVIQFLSLLSMTNRLFLAFAQVCLHCSLLYFTFYVPVSSGGACFFIVWDWSAFVPAFNARALIALQSITCEREKIKITVLAARLPACPPARPPARLPARPPACLTLFKYNHHCILFQRPWKSGQYRLREYWTMACCQQTKFKCHEDRIYSSKRPSPKRTLIYL